MQDSLAEMECTRLASEARLQELRNCDSRPGSGIGRSTALYFTALMGLPTYRSTQVPIKVMYDLGANITLMVQKGKCWDWTVVRDLENLRRR